MWTTEHTIVTDASKESVWNVWADVENWSKWDKGVEWCRIEGEFKAGTKYTLKPVGGPEAKAVMMNSISVMLNMLMGVVPAAIVASSGRGMDSVSRMNATDIRICMERVHHLLVLMMSTNGLQKGLIVHGR